MKGGVKIESSLILTPGSITENSLAVTIPGAAVTGNYALQAVKDEYTLSNPVSLSIISWRGTATQLSGARCKGTLTVTVLFGSATRDQ